MKNKLVGNYIAEIKQIIAQARAQAYVAVNSAMTQAYWLVGKRIIEEEQHGKKRANYGEEVLLTLSKELIGEFGKGFSYANLRNFRQFYLSFPEDQICYALRSKLTWTHYRLIMRVSDNNARNYYLKECADCMWSTRTLERNINTHYYQRLLSSGKKKVLSATKHKDQYQIEDFIKDPYIYEFLNVAEPLTATEKDIETALINNLQKFLLELGKGFSFIGRQVRISAETTHFYVDLVFYNYILKCFVLFDLKTSKLQHQDIGQMDMYVRMFDDLKRGKDDNPTIGIVLCANKDETIVRYSVLQKNKRLFAAKYLPYLPTEKELAGVIERQKRAFLLQSKISHGHKDFHGLVKNI
jgi:predicted nuclease of restriction endonuclease-like (RecB) superfamily